MTNLAPTEGGPELRTTLTLDDELVAKARAFTGLNEKSSLVREGSRLSSSGKRSATSESGRRRTRCVDE
jgi:hypothetical protein